MGQFSLSKTRNVTYTNVGGNYILGQSGLRKQNSGQVIKIYFYVPVLFTLSLTCSAQSDNKLNSTEDSLRIELRKTNRILATTKEHADRLMYLLTAKEMALRSTELRDSTFQALVAVQAYNFNENHKGNPADIDIYRALYKALERFKDPMLKTLTNNGDKDISTKIDALASKLCSCVKRNMKVDEWNKFSSQLPYEKTCGTSK